MSTREFNSWKWFEALKYANRCQGCRCTLDVGAPAFGHYDLLRRPNWRFLCPECFERIHGPEAFSAVKSRVKGAKDDEGVDGSVADLVDDDGAERVQVANGFKEAVTTPKTLLEELAETAPWRFNTERRL